MKQKNKNKNNRTTKPADKVSDLNMCIMKLDRKFIFHYFWLWDECEFYSNL